jgi:hypothetical protein
MDSSALIPLTVICFSLALAYRTGRLFWAVAIPALPALAVALYQSLTDPAWVLLLVAVIAAPVAGAGLMGAVAGRWLRGRLPPTPARRQWVAFVALLAVVVGAALVAAGPMLDADYARASGGAQRFTETHPEVLAATGKVGDMRVTGRMTLRDSPRPFEDITFQVTGERAVAWVTVNVSGTAAAPAYSLQSVVPVK